MPFKLFFTNIYQKFIAAKSTDEDIHRREFILNVILIATIGLLGWSEFYLVISKLEDGLNFRGVPVIVLTAIFLLFLILYWLSRKGLITAASYLVIAVYFFSITYAVYHWGPDLPTALLSFGLIITMASVLINSRFGFTIAGLIAITLITLGFLYKLNIVNPERVWVEKTLYVSDTIEYSIVLIIIAIISWLSNREIDRSLRRARKSEAALKLERDSLEMRVERRTEEIHQLQMQRVTELHHFAELGKLANGFFHDLMNPLTALTLAVEQFGSTKAVNKSTVAEQLDKALLASRRVGELITALRHFGTATAKPQTISLNDELRRLINLLDYSARQHHLRLEVQSTREFNISLNPYDFYNIVYNLVAFSIKEANDYSTTIDKVIIILLHQKQELITLEIIYPNERLPQFTEDGNDLSLLITKNILEKLGGRLKVKQSKTDHIVVLSATFRT